METTVRSGSHYFQWKPFFSVEAICFIGSCSFQWKILFLVETIPFSGSHYFQWKPLAYSSIHSMQWKLFLLMEGISFIGSYYLFIGSYPFQCNLLVQDISSSGSHSFQGKPLFFVETIAPFFLAEAVPFNRSFPFQWKPFYLMLQHFRQEKLSPVT